jgi:TetR/AcrR family transcriptional repressor of nem operon
MARAVHREPTRERIVAAASAAFRRRGYAATGVDAVMAEAGMMHGGFCTYFPSKAELLKPALLCSTRPAVNQPLCAAVGLSGPALLEASIAAYRSMQHRDHPENGCSLPTLGAEIPRLNDGMTAVIAAS